MWYSELGLCLRKGMGGIGMRIDDASELARLAALNFAACESGFSEMLVQIMEFRAALCLKQLTSLQRDNSHLGSLSSFEASFEDQL